MSLLDDVCARFDEAAPGEARDLALLLLGTIMSGLAAKGIPLSEVAELFAVARRHMPGDPQRDVRELLEQHGVSAVLRELCGAFSRDERTFVVRDDFDGRSEYVLALSHDMHAKAVEWFERRLAEGRPPDAGESGGGAA